jgi:hypothetical protein
MFTINGTYTVPCVEQWKETSVHTDILGGSNMTGTDFFKTIVTN